MLPSQWRESYRTHINAIDAQHIGLFDTAAKLAYAIERGEGEQVVRNVIFTLLDYTRTHFADEEALLKRVGYPDLEKHMREHAQFILTVRKWLEAPSAVQSNEVLTVIEQWLVIHITRSDAAYAPYVLRENPQPQT